jgi:tetratricopeptide (TPR) repeat protein
VALRARAQLLETFIEPASRLPTTINHCDLRPQNAAERADGSCILYDWDDAVAGPAGLSLHAQFGGCATPAALLEGGDALSGVEDARRKGELFETYIAELVNGGYASEKLLRQGLAGAICAGVLYYLLGYKSYPHESRSYKKTIGRIFEKRLSDLLDLCDMVSLRSGDLALEHALDYQQNGRPWRAESILRRLLWNPQHQNDAKAYAQLARVLHQRGKRSEATSFYREALQLGPQDPELHTDLGLALLERLRFDEAVARFRKAVHLDAAHKAAARSLDRACELRRAYEAAGRGGVVPTLRITDAESEAKEIRAETLALGHKLFEEYGVLLIENAYDPALAHACKEVFLEKYAAYLHDQRHDDALSLGDKRFQVTIEIAGVFSDPGIYGNPLIMSLMSKLLGKKFILGSVTSSISLPGSEEQRLHKDHPALFPTSKGYVPTPTFAVTTMVPLVALDETIGTTRVKKGSHLLTTRAAGSLPYQVPICPLGSCFLMDFRLSHRGQANRSHLSRPILNMVYQRPWFRDAVNFAKQPPLHVRPSEYERIPDELKRLFAWAMEPGPDVR